MKIHPKATQVRSALRELVAFCEGVECAAAITTDGYVIEASSHTDIERERFGAMSASLVALADRLAQEVDQGKLKQVLVESDQGIVLLVQAGTDAVLALVARPNVSLGLAFIEARKSAQKIKGILVE